MESKLAAKLLIMSIVVIASLTAVYAAKETCEGMVAKPSGGLSIATITGGINFIMAGGIGSVLILVIAFVLGFVISHVVWRSF